MTVERLASAMAADSKAITTGAARGSQHNAINKRGSSVRKDEASSWRGQTCPLGDLSIR